MANNTPPSNETPNPSQGGGAKVYDRPERKNLGGIPTWTLVLIFIILFAIAIGIFFTFV